MSVQSRFREFISLGYQTLRMREKESGHTAILRLSFWNSVASTFITLRTTVHVAANQNNCVWPYYNLVRMW